jgi:hypothetical protein
LGGATNQTAPGQFNGVLSMESAICKAVSVLGYRLGFLEMLTLEIIANCPFDYVIEQLGGHFG